MVDIRTCARALTPGKLSVINAVADCPAEPVYPDQCQVREDPNPNPHPSPRLTQFSPQSSPNPHPILTQASANPHPNLVLPCQQLALECTDWGAVCDGESPTSYANAGTQPDEVGGLVRPPQQPLVFIWSF